MRFLYKRKADDAKSKENISFKLQSFKTTEENNFISQSNKNITFVFDIFPKL